MKKRSLFTAGVTLILSSTGHAAPKSELLATGSGHYAQILIGPAPSIVPIRFKTNSVGILQTSNCGAGISVTPVASPHHVTGKPDVDACSMRFTVGSEEIEVEIYRLPEAPPPEQWTQIITDFQNSVKLPPENGIFITSDLVSVAEKTIPAYTHVLNIDKARKEGTGELTLEEAAQTDVVSVAPLRQTDLNRYKSCKFTWAAGPDGQEVLRARFIAEQVGVIATDPIIEACELTFKGESPALTEQPAPFPVVSYFVVKSYL